MLVQNQQLTESQQQALIALSACCQLTDGGLPMLYHRLLLQKRDSENNILFYRNNDLLGFLSVYFFYEKACEISVMVTPTHRRQGIGRILLGAIIPLLDKKGMDTLIFSTPASIQNTWLTKKGLIYQQSDYHMVRESFEPILISKPSLEIRKAELSDIDALCQLDTLCFPADESSTSLERFHHLLKDNDYSVFIALMDNKVVGKAHIRWQENEAALSDIAITPLLQGQGLGGELLAFCINYALIQGEHCLSLDVETRNKNALSLYQKRGFQTKETHDYWQVSLKKIKKQLINE